MNNLSKEAAKDAEKWMAAEMFYGEGAGTRRKLTWAEIQGKGMDDEAYIEAFESAYANLDMTKFAEMAVKERKAMDRAAKAGKNFRAIKSGNLHNLTNGVFALVGIVYLAHVTGADKVIEAKAKELYNQTKIEIEHWRLKRRNARVVADQAERFHI